MTEVLRGVAAVVVRDARVFWSYRLRPLQDVIGAIFTVALFYELARLVNDKRFPTSAAYFEFAVVGLAVLPLLRFGLVTPVRALREELLAGTFERIALSPLGPVAGLMATLVFAFAVAIVTGILILLVAAVFFGLHLMWPGALVGLPVAVLVALAIAPLATFLLAAGVLFKQVSAGAGWVIAGLGLVGGVYFPPALLPRSIRWISDAEPLKPALGLLRHILTGAPAGAPIARELGVLIAFSGFGLPLAALALRAACDTARRRGTLLES